jgi:2-oxoisovalerate dehydrogenase E1 component
MKGVNRAEICDVNFQEFVRDWNGMPMPGRRRMRRSWTAARWTPRVRELFESQLISRHLDLMARVLRVQNKVFYTIRFQRPRRQRDGRAPDAAHGSRPSCTTAPAAFMAERFPEKLPGMDPIMDSALSVRRKQGRSRIRRPPQGVGVASALWVMPQTVRRSRRTCPRPSARRSRSSRDDASARQLPIPDDSIAICSFGDAFEQRTPRRRPRSMRPRGRHTRSCRPGAVRVRGQRHRHFGQDADRLDCAQLSAIAPTSTISSPTAWTSRPATARCRPRSNIAAHAQADVPAPAHDADHGPRRHRLRDRVAFDRGMCAVEAGDPLLRSAQIALESGLMSKDEDPGAVRADPRQVFRGRPKTQIAVQG